MLGMQAGKGFPSCASVRPSATLGWLERWGGFVRFGRRWLPLSVRCGVGSLQMTFDDETLSVVLMRSTTASELRKPNDATNAAKYSVQVRLN